MTSGSVVQSVDRAVGLLETMADLGRDAGPSELAAAAQLPVPTICRLMRSLVLRGYARQLPSRRYTLGPRLIRLGENASRQLGAAAGPLLERLARELGESASLAMIDRDMVLYIAEASSARPTRTFTEVGRRMYCHCTGAGKMVLSQLPDQTIREIVGRVGIPPATDLSITNIEDLITEMDKIRRRGFAVDDQEQEIGVRCFAVPVPGAPTPSAVSFSGPAARVSHDFGEAAVPVLHHVAADLASTLLTARGQSVLPPTRTVLTKERTP